MLLAPSAALLFALATTATALDKDVTTIRQDSLPVGQKFEVRTADQVLRGRLVDQRTGQCELVSSTDGVNFSPPRTVFLLGATAGAQDRQTLVLMGEMKVGLKLELGEGDLDQRNRQITSEVTALRLVE